MRHACLALALAVLLGVPATAGDAPGAYFTNDSWGYKVRVPKGWRQAAMSADEEWIASKHIGKRELEAKKSRWWTREEPEMWVIGFPHVRKDQKSVKRVDKGDRSELTFNIPYRDYKDFIKRNKNFLTWENGGYFFSKEDETEINGVKVTQYEIKMEKLVNTPRRVVCWVYHFEDIDFAIQFKILEDHYKSYKSGFKSCLKSFKRAKRKKALPGSAATKGEKIIDTVDIDSLPPQEREKALKDAVKRKFQRELDAMPEGWKSKESEHYLVLYNADEKSVKRTLNHAEVVRAHLEKTFGGVGDRYVPPGILRIFDSESGRDAYANSTRSAWDTVPEVLVFSGKGYEKDREMDRLNQNIWSQWLSYRNRNVWMNMPGWLSSGLRKYLSMLRTKGKRIDFTNENWSRDYMRLEIKKGNYIQLKDLISAGILDPMNMTPEARAKYGQNSQQASSVVYWLMTKGNRGKYKDLVARYVDFLIQAVEEEEAKFRAKMDEIKAAKEKAAAEAQAVNPHDESEDQNEDEYDPKEFYEQMGKAFKEKRSEILRKTFERAFAGWTDKDWKRFTAKWLSHAK